MGKSAKEKRRGRMRGESQKGKKRNRERRVKEEQEKGRRRRKDVGGALCVSP